MVFRDGTNTTRYRVTSAAADHPGAATRGAILAEKTLVVRAFFM